MKIRLPNVLLIIDILVVVLILSITFIPSNIIRIILGLPFLLFFPGYLLLAVLFFRKESMDNLERFALSFGMSIAIVPLIGLALNYTTWGIRLNPVLYSVSAFILIMSGVALLRQYQLFKKVELIGTLELKLPGWDGNTTNKALSVILAISIIGAIGVLGYTIAKPKVGERFTEFYILGLNDKAQDYPSAFVLEGGRVTRVKYGTDMPEVAAERGIVTLGVVNHEYETTSYRVTMTIDGNSEDIFYNNENLTELGLRELAREEKWEGEIGFAPQHTGDNQKVEVSLMKNDESEPYLTLHLWIDVR
ncbi:DUF1616 domain-containing protein [Chloroflexota bacterium]